MTRNQSLASVLNTLRVTMQHLRTSATQAVVAGVLMVTGTPTLAQGVPASFDCDLAERTVDRFICVHADLRWQDLALSRSYAAARAATSGSDREQLVHSQRDWVRERDRRCVGDGTFKALSDTASPLGNLAYGCLSNAYLDRRKVLMDLAATPHIPSTITPLDLSVIEEARPELVTESGLRVVDIQSSPDGTLLAIILPSLEIDRPDQVWLYRVADGKQVAATPQPDMNQPHPDDAPMAVEILTWHDGTLYTRVTAWGAGDDPEHNPDTIHAATMDGHRPLTSIPDDVRAWIDAARPDPVSPDEVAADDREIPDSVRSTHDFLVWNEDFGHGTIELKMRARSPDASTYRIAWGSWDLLSYVLNRTLSQIVYAANTGIVVFDMATHQERRIAGTARGDRPYGVSDDGRLLIWSTQGNCGDERLEEPPDEAPERFCMARLPSSTPGG